MKVDLEKPGTPDELVHFGKKGMKWGVRNTQRVGDTVVSRGLGISTTGNRARSAARTAAASSKTPRAPMSTKKKVAIGVGVGVAVVGGAVVAGHILGSRGKIRISDIDGGKENIIRLKNGKGAISTLTHKQWDLKISEAKASARRLDTASKSIAARRKMGMPGYRPGETLGKSISKTSEELLRGGRPRKVRITGGEIFRS